MKRKPKEKKEKDSRLNHHTSPESGTIDLGKKKAGASRRTVLKKKLKSDRLLERGRKIFAKILSVGERDSSSEGKKIVAGNSLTRKRTGFGRKRFSASGRRGDE